MKKNSTLLITGGTGSFGNAVLKRFINDPNLDEIRIFSRDEKKQDDMRKYYNSSKIKFYIGDVRNSRSLDDALIGVDYVFHAAALKQVPSCEFFPMEAVQTNIIGTDNVLSSSIKAKVKTVVVLSTDKAAYPINAMGISKAMVEKITIAKSRNLVNSDTKLCCTRYGNVMGSRGSVIPLFIDQIKSKKNITITEPQMTRFMMTLEDAVDLVMYAFNEGENGDLFVQKAPACTVEVLATALKELYNSDSKITKIGIRHGEKMYETLVGMEDMSKSIDLGEYYRIPADNRDLNYEKYYSTGHENDNNKEYNSNNTQRLSIEETKKLLLKLPFVKEDLGEIIE